MPDAPAATPDAGTVGRPRTGRRKGALARLLRHRSGSVGLVLTTFFVFLAVAGPWIAPYDPAKPDYTLLTAGSQPGHWLGTDAFGRDTLSRVLAGARYSITIGLSATLLGALVGGALGLWAGFAGGWIDSVSMRVVDVMLAFPGILLAIGLVTLTGPGVGPVVLASAVFGIPVFARLTRGSTLAVKERAFVEAAGALGARGGRIMLRHLLPSVIAPVIVFATLRSGSTLLVASGLSFLGLGVQPPAPEWGGMLSDAQLYLTVQPLMAFAPGIAITLAVLGFNLLGDGLRDVLDPTVRT
ncbi:MAG: ABC transporter permease [Trueperaceae bacterium]|nr:ABC transporter permease [Trueperaceae bacterium]